MSKTTLLQRDNVVRPRDEQGVGWRANFGHNGTLTLSSRSLAAFGMACGLGCEQ